MVKPSKAMPQLYANTPVQIATDAPIYMLEAMGVVGPEEALLYRPFLSMGFPSPSTIGI